MPIENILHEIGGHDADPAELEHVLLSYFGRSTQPTDDLVLYGDEEQPALELRYSGNGKIVSLKPGPAFKEADRNALQEILRDQVLSTGAVKVGRNVMFAATPTIGWFRFRDEFQIIPVPPDAPRPEGLVGDHPFLLEVTFPSSANASVSMLRRSTRQREVELLCSLFLQPNVRGQSNLAAFHWVYEPIASGNLVSTFRQSGYSWTGANFQGDNFSPIVGLPPLVAIEPQAYYSRLGISAGQTLEIPASLTESFELFHSLKAKDRKRFLRATYWYQQSFKTWLVSSSIAFETLVCAVEALMPPSKAGEPCPTCGHRHGAGPTQIFASFVDRFVPDLSLKERRKFYSLRSAISHGGKLLRADEVGWGIGAQQANEAQDMRSLSTIVRAVLINWLHTPEPR